MLKKTLGKAAAGTAAASLILVPTAMLSGSPISLMACDYEDPANTSTDVSLNKTVAPYGSKNVAHVDVSTSGSKTPKGKVKLRLKGVENWTLTLDGGSASQRLPRNLDAGKTYQVKANYQGACKYRPSNGNAFYTVNKAGVNVNPTVNKARKAKFSASFEGTGGLDPRGGRAKFIVEKPNGKNIRKQVTGVRAGRADVNMKNLKKNRNYTLKVKFYGTANFESARDTRDFNTK